MNPEEEIGRLLLARGWTLATAESCTGGLLGHKLTGVAGSSDYYLGGVVSYANAAKQKLLGVRPETLLEHGAVSAQTALEMARGARAALQADVAVAVTGVAGPGGGTPEKPVGCVWIAVCSPAGEQARNFLWDADRAGNKELSAQAALEMVIEAARAEDSTKPGKMAAAAPSLAER